MPDEESGILCCDEGEKLQLDKEYLSILTYPAGRGTTGNGSIIVYKNDEEFNILNLWNTNFIITN